MKKFFASIIASLILIAAMVATVVPAAHAAEINAGWCRQSVDPQDRHYIAPGVARNGPLVFVDGKPVSTNGVAFDGFMGCYR